MPKPCSLIRVAALSVLMALTISPHVSADENQPVNASLGIMVGEVTPTTAFAQVRLSRTERLVDRDLPGASGVVEFRLFATRQRNGWVCATRRIDTQIITADPEHDYIARAAFSNLKPGTQYMCFTRIGSHADQLRWGPTAHFRTLPGPKQSQSVRFVVVTGMNYAKFHGDQRIDQAQHLIENNTKLPAPYSGPDKHLGYPSLATILARRPHFFIGTGDNVYYDTPDQPRAETIPQMRQKWHEQFVQPRYRDLFAFVPTYWEIDDHDYRIDDGDNTGDYAPSPAEGRRMMLEQLPVAAAGDEQAKTYRTHRVSRELQIWLPENRMHRSPNADPDGPEKSIWGSEQKQWLKETLLASNATFKLIISPTPMIGPDDLRKTDNHTNINGFRHERDEFFAWLHSTGLSQRHVYFVCGDRHWQYHAIDPSGLEEFSCGALVDANSRLGRKPGDPKSTDPDGLITQKYYQTPRSGGFLQIQVDPGTASRSARLTFAFNDERGRLLYSETKTGGTPADSYE